MENKVATRKCTKCGRVIMLPRVEFNKKIKKVVKK